MGYQELVQIIDEEGEGLTSWEAKFIGDMIDNPPDVLSDKQKKIINDIYERI